MPTTNAHKFCHTQSTTSAALLKIQLIIAPMMPGHASAVLAPNLPSKLTKALSLFLIYSPFSFLDGGLPTAPPPAAVLP